MRKKKPEKRAGGNAKYRPNVPERIKEALLKESGGKCANPGCPNSLVQFHHIKEWHVYQTHDEKDMIAVCATCHDHIHRGSLRISDGELRTWKALGHTTTGGGHIYVAPGPHWMVKLGTIYVTKATANPVPSFQIFSFSERNHLEFDIVGRDVVQPSACFSDSNGRELIRLDRGHVRHDAGPPVRYESRPGRYRLIAPAGPPYVPEWVIESYNRKATAPLVRGEETALFDINVFGPGDVEVQGAWSEGSHAFVVSETAITFIDDRGRCQPFMGCDDPLARVDRERRTVLVAQGVCARLFTHSTGAPPVG